MSDIKHDNQQPTPASKLSRRQTPFSGLHFEPFWWGLFSAGGVCVAIFVPALALILGILWPLGVIDIERIQLASWYQSVWGLLFTGAVIVLPAFHAAHRIRHGLFDLKISQGRGYASYLCYGSAAVIGGLALLAWVMVR